MIRFFRRLAALGVVAAFATPVVAGAANAKTPPSKPAGAFAITATSAILIDLSDGGQILFQRNVNALRPPASLTKIVTALVVRDQYRLDEVVTIDRHVLGTDGSGVGLRPGMHFVVRDLLYAMLLPSANDAAAALAAHHPMGYDHFIRLMNEKARSLGAYHSFFHNPHGLDAIGHVSSAHDMAIFARQVLADPVLAQIVRTHRFALPWPDGTKRIITNHNALLTRYPGTIGMKTGFTAQAGHCLIAAAQTPEATMLTVVLNSRDHYADTTALFEYGKRLLLTTSSGGGGPETSQLSLPPAVPVLAGLAAAPAPPTGTDPRDHVWWTWMTVALAVLTIGAAAGRRGSNPLRRAAEFHAWLEPAVSKTSTHPPG